MRSTDGGYNWTFAAVVASAEDVPQASEGPSEGALAMLKNGSLMAVMRCDGQSGHCPGLHNIKYYVCGRVVSRSQTKSTRLCILFKLT